MKISKILIFGLLIISILVFVLITIPDGAEFGSQIHTNNMFSLLITNIMIFTIFQLGYNELKKRYERRIYRKAYEEHVKKRTQENEFNIENNPDGIDYSSIFTEKEYARWKQKEKRKR